LTQTFGLGLFTAPDIAQFERIEQFYATRRCSVHHEVSPLADSTLTAMLGARGYLPIENSTVLHQPLPALAAEGAPAAITVRAIGAGEAAMWADASALGWSEFEGLEAFMRDIGVMLTAAHNVTCFVAELDGVIAATGALVLHEGVALLAGASTVPAYRHRGAQNALLAARLRFARSSGCDLAMITTQPGSPSQRNAERNGFRVAYTRTKWFRA
jgi:GNAT superfamily N-acetyltransferase